MGFDKQELIKGYLRTIEQNEEKIIEYSKSCDSSKRRIRALERDLLKKRNKELRKLRNWKMNKQELIEKYKSYEGKWNAKRAELARQIFIEDLKLLEEPRKVKVKKFVADWITHSKNIGRALFGAMSIFEENIEIKKWMQWAENQETFARAWLDGYEIEKEKRYKVVMPNVSSSGGVLTRIKHNDSWIWIDTLGTIVEGRTHTRKELEDAGFGWVFDCPGIEIEEVE